MQAAASSRLVFGRASLPLGGTPWVHEGPGDAPAVVLPTLVDLAENLGQPEGHQETDHGPRRIELAAEGGELRRGRAGVVVVVQTLPEGDRAWVNRMFWPYKFFSAYSHTFASAIDR